MFTPVKAITAGALVFALGGLFLIAQPFDRQGGGVPGAEQGADPPAPVKVTATFIGLDCEEGSGGTEGSIEVDGPVQRTYGGSCTVHREWSDPRLRGTETSIVNGVEYLDDSELFIAHYVHDIVTDEGAWRMRPQFRFDAETRYSSGIWVLDGEGAHEGLSVVLAMDASTFAPLTGYIISTDLVPPAPEGGSTK